MRQSIRRLRSVIGLTASLLMLLASATSARGEDEAPKRDNDYLNDGYSMIYEAVSGLRLSDDLLRIKFENDQVDKVVTGYSDLGSKLREKLEELADKFPAMDLERSPMPEMEKLKRKAMRNDKLKSYVPFAGKTGVALERTLLLSASGVLDQLIFMSRVMREHEPDKNLQKFLKDAEADFKKLYDIVVKLLNRRYFKHNTYRSKD